MDFKAGANIPTIKIYPDKFSGQVIVITGGGRGIGAQTATLFAQQGAQVVLLDVIEDNLQKTNRLILDAGGKCTWKLCDIGDESSVDKTIDWVVKEYHKIDVLVNLAGIYPFHSLIGYPTNLYRKIMSVNVDGSFFLSRAVAPHMRKAGYGRIIHTSSSSVQVGPLPDHSAYVTSKMAVIGLVRSTAADVGPGVTVNAIMPGLTRSETIWSQTVQADGTNQFFENVLQRQMVKRSGQPSDIAHAICFIASPEAQFFTAQIFDCSGGCTFH